MTRSVRLSVCPKLLVKTVHYGTMLLLKIDVKSFKVLYSCDVFTFNVFVYFFERFFIKNINANININVAQNTIFKISASFSTLFEREKQCNIVKL